MMLTEAAQHASPHGAQGRAQQAAKLRQRASAQGGAWAWPSLGRQCRWRLAEWLLPPPSPFPEQRQCLSGAVTTVGGYHALAQ